MKDPQRLAELRAQVAAIDSRYAGRSLSEATRAAPMPAMRYVEDWIGGEVVETSFGCHFETEKLYEPHRHHGRADIGALADLPHDLLCALLDGRVASSGPEEWVFLDTETTGLGGVSGACAFLVGVGRIAADGFRVRQFFMRDYREEASLLHSLARYLGSFRIMITYNGRAYDQPLLENRYRVQRCRHPFAAIEHLDLLHGARRLWKLRFESCRLVELENRILGVERQGDLPATLIPCVYFEYLRTRQAARLLPVFQHNALDILSLACLTGIVPYAFKDPVNVALRHGTEMASIGRWLKEAGEIEAARTMLRRALDAGLPDAALFRTLWDLATIERKLGAADAALEIWNDLATAPNPFRAKALEELAKHYEHHYEALRASLQGLGTGTSVYPRRARSRRFTRSEAPRASADEALEELQAIIKPHAQAIHNGAS